jgi:hypothetical protein
MKEAGFLFEEQAILTVIHRNNSLVKTRQQPLLAHVKKMVYLTPLLKIQKKSLAGGRG